MENITDVHYRHAMRVCKMNNLDGYHDFYVQSDTLLLADVLKILETCVLKYMN